VAQPNILYYVEATFASAPEKVRGRNVSLEKIYDTQIFKNEYTYAGDDLGPTFTPEYTEFKLWAPTAVKVVLKRYFTGTPSTLLDVPNESSDGFRLFQMTCAGPKESWYVKIMGQPPRAETITPLLIPPAQTRL
jgi:1,4-alpha-glucan branching enzyme